MHSTSKKWLSGFINNIFDVKPNNFVKNAIDLFHFQYQENDVYRKYCELINCNVEDVIQLEDIPFLPISLFKSDKIITTNLQAEVVLESSGTTSGNTSKHFVHDINIYTNSFINGFERLYGKIEDYHILALLPSYLERQGSSLVLMVDEFISRSHSKKSDFFLDNLEKLNQMLNQLNQKEEKVLLIGVSFALLDYVSNFKTISNPNLVVMETGGMKGRRKEMIRQELHSILRKGFNTNSIHSEYGMTELLSQAYSKYDGRFTTPPWMKVMIRKQDDPFSYCSLNETGAINVIDFANIYSCPFIQTDDLGKIHTNGEFEVLGRFDSSDVRGCNLMIN